MNEINKQLREMYQNEQEEVILFSNKCEASWLNDERPSDESWFIYQTSYVPDLFTESTIKLLAIGQEAYGWGTDATTPIDESMQHTEKFLKTQYNTNFYQYVNDLSELLNGAKYHSNEASAYSNLFKISNDSYPKYLIKSNWQLAEEYCKQFNTLKKEIEIIKPDVVLFLTGPVYDYYLKAMFEGVEYSTVDQELSLNACARLSHISLPSNTFRLYHPSYANRKRNFLWKPVIDRIAKLVK